MSSDKKDKDKPFGKHQDTVDAWKRILKDMAPDFIRNREEIIDKEVDKLSGKERQDAMAGIKRRKA